ncbi:MAG: DUF1553 domain-containing protein, partial [Planctomycetales bacterium]|nr:DUF1553 domain-containing protein [Planctomycetales bacterium]
TGLRLEALTHGDLPFQGPGRNGTGTWGVVALEVFEQQPGQSEWTPIELRNATADFSQTETRTDDGKKAHGPVSFLIDGSDDTAWTADRGVGRRNQPSVATVQFATPITRPLGTRLKIVWRVTDMLGCARFSLTSVDAPAAIPVDYAAQQAIALPPEERTDEHRAAIFTAWYRSLPELQSLTSQIDAAWQTYPTALTSVLHMAERTSAEARTTYRLDRGQWDRPLEPAIPQVPASLNQLSQTSKPNRLDLARWLASVESPLTARVAVNRIWQAIFGEGLVQTAEDFGTRAPTPEHRELLDWLAVELMENGWSQKELVRLIVSSETYQQSSHATSTQLELDPQNRYLSRGPRFRADGEVLRDIALSVSGQLHNQLGGPPVIPPVPQNVLDYNYVYPSYWTASSGNDRYRRTIYGFRKRSMPDPVMSNFDAPNGDVSCARRIRSNTPLAALATLNETIFVESARAFALRILRDGGDSDSSRADYAFKLCTARLPTDAERNELLALLASRRVRLAEGWLNPREITTGEANTLPALPDHATPQDAAAWTLVARVLLNLDETLNKN